MLLRARAGQPAARLCCSSITEPGLRAILAVFPGRCSFEALTFSPVLWSIHLMKLSIPKILSVEAIFLAVGLVPVPVVAQCVVISAGIPFRVQIDHRYRVHTGTRVEGHLIAPVYHIDRVVLPVNTRTSGTILGMRHTSEVSRTRPLLDGQFTPPAVPAIRFDSLRLPSGATVPFQTAVTERDAEIVTMSAGKMPGLRAEARAAIEERKRQAIETLHHPNLGDRIERWIYAQLPWSPPTIWTGTEYDAELTKSVEIPSPQSAPLPEATVHGMPTGLVFARLLRLGSLGIAAHASLPLGPHLSRTPAVRLLLTTKLRDFSSLEDRRVGSHCDSPWP